MNFTVFYNNNASLDDIYAKHTINIDLIRGHGIFEGKITDDARRAITDIIHDGKSQASINVPNDVKIRLIYYLDDTKITTTNGGSYHHMSEWSNKQEVLEIGYYCRILVGYMDDRTISSVSDLESRLIIDKKRNRITELEKSVDKLRELPLNNMMLSLLGDSISAFSGTIPQENLAYYTGKNSGVSSPNEMWWSILCDKTGMIPLVINGWSGSGITQLSGAHSNRVPISDISRCTSLSNGETVPDIILIAGGVNDYTYASEQTNNPTQWDGKTKPIKGNSFGETYACMIKDIQTTYPKAIIVCLSTWFTMRGTDNGYTFVNDTGFTQADYDKEIENIARIMRVPYINVSNCGFNRNNFYPTYANDSSIVTTHPNAYGQRVMGEYIADLLPQLVKSYLMI